MAMDLTANTEMRHEMFVRRAVDQQTVWGLVCDQGWGTALSTQVPDTGVLPFWSDRAYAARCATGEWGHYEPESLTFFEFMREWIPDLFETGQRVGTNWNGDHVGRESKPDDLAWELHDSYVERVGKPFVEAVLDREVVWMFGDDDSVGNFSFSPDRCIFPAFTSREKAAPIRDKVMPDGEIKSLSLEEFVVLVTTLDVELDRVALDWEVETFGWYLHPPEFVDLADQAI